MFNDFLIRKGTWILHVIKAYIIHDLNYVYVVETFNTLNGEACINVWVHL